MHPCISFGPTHICHAFNTAHSMSRNVLCQYFSLIVHGCRKGCVMNVWFSQIGMSKDSTKDLISTKSFLMCGCSSAQQLLCSNSSLLSLLPSMSTSYDLLWGPSPLSLPSAGASCFVFFLLQEVCVLVHRLTLSYVSQFSSVNRAPRGLLQAHM